MWFAGSIPALHLPEDVLETKPPRGLQAAREVAQKCPGVTVSVFSDRDLDPLRDKIEAELDRADVFFASLLFDYDQVSCLMAFRPSGCTGR